MNKKLFITTVLIVVTSFTLFAKENEGLPPSGKTLQNKNATKSTGGYRGLAAPCEGSTFQAQMDINNVRTTINSNGDLWWNLSDARYEVPKFDPPQPAQATHSIFAGAIWIGGIDEAGQLRVAGQTYRQTGNDFWAGPLSSDGSVEKEQCDAFDNIWKVNRDATKDASGNTIDAGIDAIRKLPTSSFPVGIADVPASVLNWPGRNNPYNESVITYALNQNLAPFVDRDNDGVYDPVEDGDYPALDLGGNFTEKVVPDQMLWWVYNDKGDIHTETGSEAIGLQLRTTAFAFRTSDDINNMTFYNYDIDYFGTRDLLTTYFGVWVDPDLGCFDNDFVGCDTTRALGICYNGTPTDGPACRPGGYGGADEIPMVGVDFFRGPKDEFGNELGQSAFIYYNNDFSNIGNPENASHFYGYLSGNWKDGVPVTFGGNGRGGTDPFPYMYPSSPDDNSTSAWSECDEQNTPADRRFIHVSGPFTLKVGATNSITTGVVWVRPVEFCGSFARIGIADDKAQALFDNGFALFNPPEPPNLSVRELDREVTLALWNDSLSNNYLESFEAVDPLQRPIIEALNAGGANVDSTYNFEGYKLYQIKNSDVSITNFEDPDQAKLIYQGDLKNDINDIVNFNNSLVVGSITAPIPELKVEGNNSDIVFTHQITTDAFTGERLVNHQTYYFAAIAYAHNNFVTYNPGAPSGTQDKPYEQSRFATVVSAIPHISTAENNGTILNAKFGDGPQITRIEGQGSGYFNDLELTDESVAEILANGSIDNPVYVGGQGPIKVKVYDPLKLPNHQFEVCLIDGQIVSPEIERRSTWRITNLTTGESWDSEKRMTADFEQGIPTYSIQGTDQTYGFTVNITQPGLPYNDITTMNVLNSVNTEIEEIEVEDPSLFWYGAVPDRSGATNLNWIRGGSYMAQGTELNLFDNIYNSYQVQDSSVTPIGGKAADPNSLYENIANGLWAPYAMVAASGSNTANNTTFFNHGPRYEGAPTPAGLEEELSRIFSVDVVLTPDKSKWTRCPVVEMTEENNIAVGGVDKFNLRSSQSIDQNGNPTTDLLPNGLSYFPGYAINVETGERLAMMFGESSWLGAENGDDMIWNPSTNLFTPTGTYVGGGKHWVYVSETPYDRFQSDVILLNTGTAAAIRNVFNKVAWVSAALPFRELNSLEEGLVPTETKFRLRVASQYAKGKTRSLRANMNEADPCYQFDFNNLAATTNNLEAAKSALDDIGVVPNPYYAFSEYEKDQLDNEVKIINLPSRCNVKIFTLNGSLVKTFRLDNPTNLTDGDDRENAIDWDLKNQNGVPIAGGMYIVHIEAPGIGERSIKWFGALRPTDLDNF